MAAMNRRLLALRLLGLGWYVAVCIVIGAGGGLAIGRWLDLSPALTSLITLAGVLLGTVAAFYGLFKMVRPLLNRAPDTDSGAAADRYSPAGTPPHSRSLSRPLSGDAPHSGDASDGNGGGANGAAC